VDSKINQIIYDNDAFTVNYINGFVLTVSKDCTRAVDKYGNEWGYNSQGALFYQQNSPTYDELYKHWLKTKQND
jgi:hypothetical protein